MSEQPPEGEVLEAGRRLSESSVWRLQREFFDRRGARAWSENRVPSHVTSNAYIAEAYVRIALRFLQDLGRPVDGEAALDPARPVHVVEIGAGHGYFGYLFLCKLLELRELIPFPLPPIRYVLTDFTENNLAAWRRHERLRPFLDAGLLDFARFDAEKDGELRLERSGEVLVAGAAGNPMVVIANYVFASLSQDVFRIRGGKLEESLVTLRMVRPPRPEDRDLLEHVALGYEHRPVADAAAYYPDDPAIGRILAGYAARLGDTSLGLPLGALRCVQNLARLAGGRMLLLSADKGHARELDLLGLGDPHLAHHNGCISLMVNFHALGELVAEQGGIMLAQASRNASLEICALALAGGRPLPETRYAFDQVLERVGPTDVYRLIDQLALDKMDLDQLLAVLRMAAWDPVTFIGLSRDLHRTAGDAYLEQHARLRDALGRVWQLHFPLADGKDVGFELGYVYYAMRRYREALFFYRHSLELYGPHPVTLFNMGLCEFQQGRLDEALASFDRALAQDPSYAPARDWRMRVVAERGEALADVPRLPGGVTALAPASPSPPQPPPDAGPPPASGGVAAQDRASAVVVGVADGDERRVPPGVA